MKSLPGIIWMANAIPVKRRASWQNLPEKSLGSRTCQSWSSWHATWPTPHLVVRGPLEEKLKETSMWKVYTEIELPLVFTLDSMEKWGIEVKGEELKNYGDQADGPHPGAGEADLAAGRRGIQYQFPQAAWSYPF